MTYLLGIAGGTGSGKGTFVDLIIKHLELWELKCTILSTDNCYRDLSYLSSEQRDQLCFNPENNYDHPDLLDIDRLLAYTQYLKEGKSFSYNRYNFQTHSYDQTNPIEVPESLDVAIIEGIYALYPQQLLLQYDHRIFVDTNPVLAALRRVKRDISERGRTIDHIVRQMSTTVVPMHEKYVFPTKVNADEVVNWRVDETRNNQEITQQLIEMARQRALAIYERVKEPLLKNINTNTITISGLSP